MLGLVTLVLWGHLLATVVLVGYYVVVALIVLPVLAPTSRRDALGFIGAIERRAMPLLLLSILAFLASGVYLLTSDTRYAGIGNVGGDWATLLLVKHVLVVGMLVAGSIVDGLVVRAVRLEAAGSPTATAMSRIGRGFDAMALLGALVLLITAAAQPG